ncbi:MAG: UxaA family hydrolase [Rhodospirillales bacterium]|nr:UxaA family hydrolase [Rhodospirillales bacterium]
MAETESTEQGRPGPGFDGYHRPDGRVGVRNHLLVLSLAGLTGPTALRIGTAIAGAVTITFPYGAGLLGRDRDVHVAALMALPAHPNVGATVLLGDNPPLMAEIAIAARATGKPFASFTMDDCEQDAITMTERALRAGAELAHCISATPRRPASLSTLLLGLECGRSDPSSGLVANPLLGVIADRLGAAGGAAIIGETTEWLGAEHLLARRARTHEVAEAIRAAALAREAMAVAAGIDLTGNNPSPTNIEAGLSSIEEKSLGNIAKSGSRPIEGLLAYGEAPRGPGMWLMDAPAYAPESLTGFVLAGAQMMLFTTGVGNSYVSALAPTIKLSANPRTTARLRQQLDLDASGVFTGEEDAEQVAERLLRVVLATASGQATWGEILREGSETISRFGPAL